MQYIVPVYKLKDVNTDEIVGIQYKNEKLDLQVALTIEKATELGLSAFVDKFLDIPEIKIVTHRGRYGNIDYSMTYNPLESDIEYRESGNLVTIYGYMFEKNRILPLDNAHAINKVFQ